jgi:twitching motility protein PilT
MARLDQYLKQMRELGASDLHLMSGVIPKIRVHGELETFPGHAALSNDQLVPLLFELITEEQKKQFQQNHDLDFAYGIEGVARFRCNYCYHNLGAGAVFRLIPEVIRSIAELSLPPAVEKLAHLNSGLVLITGPTGSGKSTTLAAIIHAINSAYDKHILTIEDPIEFVHESKRCLITQREIGNDTQSFANALRAACREDADVVLVGEMRDLETISLALSVAEMGPLVFGTLHTNNASRTIDRIIDVFPSEQQDQVRIMLSESLKGIVSQQLLRTKDQKGRVGVVEILFSSAALSNIIREGKTQQIPSLIQAGKNEGMQSMDYALMDLLKKGIITTEEAYWKAQDKKLFENLMK